MNIAMDAAIDTRPGRRLKLTGRRADRATFNRRNLRNFKNERTDDAPRNVDGHPSCSTATFAHRPSAIVLRRSSILWLLSFAFGKCSDTIRFLYYFVLSVCSTGLFCPSPRLLRVRLLESSSAFLEIFGNS